MTDSNLIKIIEQAWQQRNEDIAFSKESVEQVINRLDAGEIRIAEKNGSAWVINEWAKKAILLSFKVNASSLIPHDPFNYHDKIDLKFTNWNAKDFANGEIRAVPGAVVRKSAYIGRNTVLMPSFVNVGAYIGDGTLVDTGAFASKSCDY
jgi:2,3,4,5-tetrahydropyridine-2-carboxylate N-succinyltransferase